MTDVILTQERLKELLHYNPHTGVFTRLSLKSCQKKYVAGSVITNGYIQIGIDNKRILAHRLAFIYMGVDMEDLRVDHIDGNKKNNRFSNLRLANFSQNAENKKRSKLGTKSGLMGACHHKQTDKYVSEITTNGVRQYLGIFDTAKEAHDEYIRAKRLNHKYCTI